MTVPLSQQLLPKDILNVCTEGHRVINLDFVFIQKLVRVSEGEWTGPKGTEIRQLIMTGDV